MLREREREKEKEQETFPGSHFRGDLNDVFVWQFGFRCRLDIDGFVQSINDVAAAATGTATGQRTRVVLEIVVSLRQRLRIGENFSPGFAIVHGRSGFLDADRLHERLDRLRHLQETYRVAVDHVASREQVLLKAPMEINGERGRDKKMF